MARAPDGTPPEDEKRESSYESMRRIFLMKKEWEASALRAAKSREEGQSKTSDANADDDDDAREREELSDERARGDATDRANGARDELSRLFLRQTELEKTVQEWNERIVEYERSSSREGADELDRLRRDHDDEIDRLVEKARVENEIDEEELRAAAGGDEGKRAAKGGEDGEERGRKRQRVGDSTTVGGDEDARNADAENSATGTANSNTGKVGVEGEKVSASVQKEEELKKILDEMTYLNKTKSQMIWLLKQVITAETKMKR